MHGLQESYDILLQGGGFDDSGDSSGSDQEDCYADDLGETEFYALLRILSAAGGEDTEKAAERESEERVDRNPRDRAESQEGDHGEGACNGGEEGGQRLVRSALQIPLCNSIPRFSGEKGGEKDAHDQGEERRYDIFEDQCAQIELEGLGECDGIGIWRDNVSRLASSDHREKYAAFGEFCLFSDCEGDRSDRDYGDVDEDTDRADDHGRDRDCGDSAPLPQSVDDCFRDFLRGAGFYQSTGKDAARQDAENGGHHASRAGDHSFHCIL